MQELLARIRRIGFMVVLGVCVIIYIGLGIVYMQQGPRQKDLEDQNKKTMAVVNKPLPSMEQLQAEYDKVNEALAPVETSEALKTIVDIARENGIDVNPASGKLYISPPGSPTTKKMAAGTYSILAISNIKAQADFETMMNFISDLDAGSTLETMILKSVELNWVPVSLEEAEVARRAEFRTVIQAVADMMADNNLEEIPNPMNFEGGVAVNDLTTFPDTLTTAREKGYTGTGTPSAGYILYGHDKIISDNTSEYQTVNYVAEPMTEYYYTCEADGTVRQFDETGVATATEYIGSEEVVYDAVARLSVELYTKLPKG